MAKICRACQRKLGLFKGYGVEPKRLCKICVREAASEKPSDPEAPAPSHSCLLRRETWQVYTESNSGLPNNAVQTLAETRNGTLWIGMLGGSVATFDGTSWGCLLGRRSDRWGLTPGSGRLSPLGSCLYGIYGFADGSLHTTQLVHRIAAPNGWRSFEQYRFVDRQLLGAGGVQERRHRFRGPVPKQRDRPSEASRVRG
jgi:hypothetical protein